MQTQISSTTDSAVQCTLIPAPPLSWSNFNREQPSDVMDTTESENSEMDEDYRCEEHTSDVKWYSHLAMYYNTVINYVHAVFYVGPVPIFLTTKARNFLSLKSVCFLCLRSVKNVAMQSLPPQPPTSLELL